MIENPQIFIKTNYQIEYCLYEGWLPSDKIEDGHKHLNILSFEESIPEIIKLLHVSDSKRWNPTKEYKTLGFCNSNDFESISKHLKMVKELKANYGESWWEHDIEN